MKQVYPKLDTFCKSLGFDFQVVDMRWGVRDEAADDHTTIELCLKELLACQKVSTGPYFVVSIIKGKHCHIYIYIYHRFIVRFPIGLHIYLHNIVVQECDDEFWSIVLRTDALPDVNNMRGMQYRIILNPTFRAKTQSPVLSFFIADVFYHTNMASVRFLARLIMKTSK